MLRALAILGLAFVCLGSVRGGGGSSASWQEFALWGGISGQQQDQATALRAQAENAQRVALYAQQQQMAGQQIEAAELHLQNSLQSLQHLRSRYPNSADLDHAISNLQDLLAQVQQARQQAQAQIQQAQQTAHAQSSTNVGDADVASIANQTERLNQISEMVQTRASQGAALAAQTIAGLSRASSPPARRPPSKAPVARPSQHAGRSPASVAPEETLAPPPHPPQTAAANSPDETEWFSRLKNGLLQYSVPETMLWKVSSTVTVQIQGEKVAAPGPIDHQTDQGAIKVARHMKVLVSAPDNPDEFTIAPESDTQLEQYVPEDGPTIWHFDVTPRYTAKDQKLVVQAWVIYDANTQRELPVYRTVVNVHVPSLGECLKRLIEGDPDYWLKYGLPGGAGFIFLSGLVTGIWKWLTRKRSQAAQPAVDR
jgi:hypothetical protein